MWLGYAGAVSTIQRVVTTDAEIDAAIARASVYEQHRPKAVAVAYSAAEDVVAITLATGAQLLLPRTLLQGLERATAEELGDVAIEDHGSSLHWERLDVDHYVPGLIDGVFGNRRWMSAIGKKGRATRSAAKTAAARRNGQRGGRPKHKVQSIAEDAGT